VNARWDRWRWLVWWVTRWEVAELRLFGRSVISVAGRRNVLVLETVGRKTGKLRRTPVTYRVEEGGTYVIGGGAGGMTKVDWLANLRARDEAAIVVRRKRLRVTVQEVSGAERDAMHAEAAQRWPEVNKYEAVRRVPYFRLTPE
jgi:deazaflavin-dependent oxidoreductase (nitroreductase family)